MDFKVLVTDINAVTALCVSTLVLYMSSLDAMYGHIQQQFAAIEDAEENDNTGGQLTPLVISNHHYKSSVAFVIHLRGLIVLLPHLTFFTAFYLLHVGTIVVSVSYLLFVGTGLVSNLRLLVSLFVVILWLTTTPVHHRATGQAVAILHEVIRVEIVEL